MDISKSIKALAAFCLVLASSLTNAQVLEVNIWKPKLGGTIAAAQKEAALINEAGGSASGDGDVYQVFIWEPMPGRSADLYRAAAQAKALHEKDGAAVTIHSDQMGHLHYSMNFKTWEDWAKFQDAEHAEFDAFMAEVQKDPSGALIEVYTASILD